MTPPNIDFSYKPQLNISILQIMQVMKTIHIQKTDKHP